MAPRIIFSAWLQGVASAPAIVQLCLERWARLNPAHELHVLDAAESADLLAGLSLPALPAQALSDILRIKLLLERGGIWVDATLFPVVPLQDWLPAQEFFAFAQPGPDRPIASWFLAAAPGHEMIQKLWREVLHFWDRPRTMALYNGGLVAPNPVASVAPTAGRESAFYPYFWLHYLFAYLLESDAAFAASWAACLKLPAGPPHALQTFCNGPGPFLAQNLAPVARLAPVQKLNWRAPYPLAALAQF